MITRRDWMRASAGLAGASLLKAVEAPAATVAVTRCRTYSAAEVTASLERLFDQIGGLGRIVKGKTVAVKVNLTGAPSYRLGHLPLGDTHYTNPQMIAGAVHLMGKAGAKRVRILESP